jgi:hypothetical protein
MLMLKQTTDADTTQIKQKKFNLSIRNFPATKAKAVRWIQNKKSYDDRVRQS